MITALMAYSLLTGALVVLAAVSLELVFRARKWPVRFVWAGAMALTLAIAIAAAVRSSRETHALEIAGVPYRDLSTTTVLPLSTASWLLEQLRSVVAASAAPVTTVSRLAARAGANRNAFALTAWLAATCAALAALGTTYWRFAQRRALWPSAQLHGLRVRITPDVGPAVMGIAPPEIVIPQWVLTRHANEQRMVVLHELEHVRAHDPLLLLTSCVAVALMPWNAALWYMWSRLRLAVEIDCDHRVLQHGMNKPDYGELLIKLSGQRSELAPGMPSFSLGTSHLERRLLEMTSRKRSLGRTRASAAAAVALVALVVACTSELPTASDIEHMDASKVMARVPTSGPTIYTVDADTVTEKAARAIPEERIKSISVVRADKKRPSQVAIKLKTSPETLVVSADGALLTNGGNSVMLSGNVKVDRSVGMNAASATADQEKDGMAKVVLRSVRPSDKPYILVNGVAVDDLASVDSDKIVSVEIVKGPEAVRLYGSNGSKGVIVIQARN